MPRPTALKHYLVLVRGSGPGFDKLDDEARQALYASWGDYVRSLSESGHWVSGNPLENSGRLYHGQHDVTDGVVGEADISVGGYMILEAENYDAAIKLCEACPTLTIGGKLELRECGAM